MSRACAALSDFDFSSDDSSSSDEDEKVKRKPSDFTGLCLMGKSSRHISDSDVLDGGLEDTWLMDSGCSRHMSRNKKWFSGLIPLLHKEYVTFGDDKKGKVFDTGIIKVND
jgi:hypothetical protein